MHVSARSRALGMKLTSSRVGTASLAAQAIALIRQVWSKAYRLVLPTRAITWAAHSPVRPRLNPDRPGEATHRKVKGAGTFSTARPGRGMLRAARPRAPFRLTRGFGWPHNDRSIPPTRTSGPTRRPGAGDPAPGPGRA